ncbi:MAG TPA: class I SAM-dependent methyltransferase, partial [Verrucomicrobiae bacterium]
MADVGTNDVVYDLGSGDGRIVIAAVRDFGARRAVGIEINPQLVQESRENAVQAGVANRVQFINGDLFTNDFSQASVVVLYLGHGANLDLRAKLVRNLKPGARVVSHQFGMGEWTADKLLDVRTIYLGMYGEWFNEFKTNSNVPDFDNTGSQASHDVLSAWIVPAPVAGVWRGKVRLEMGDGDLQITLHQSLSGVTGSFQFTGSTNISGSIRADLWG